MSNQSITKNNHYIPRMYLKRFQSQPGRIYRYDLLVPDKRCPDWVEKSIDSAGSAPDLYTSLDGGCEVDTHEKWLNSEFETPAAEALELAVTGRRMSKEHWRRLVRFIAAQDVRTPSRLHEDLERWKSNAPAVMEECLRDLDEMLKSMKGRTPLASSEAHKRPGFPIRVHVRPSMNDPEMAEVGLEAVAGRGTWLWGQRHLLGGVASHLHEHQWTILVAPGEVTWPTTDTPVIRLNYNNDQNYDFKGGWGSRGTEIIMPLGPKHLVYTKIGYPRPERGTVLDVPLARQFKKLICMHAFRQIFSPTEDKEITILRRRTVNLEKFRQEKSEWEKFAAEQTEAESQLMRPLPGG